MDGMRPPARSRLALAAAVVLLVGLLAASAPSGAHAALAGDTGYDGLTSRDRAAHVTLGADRRVRLIALRARHTSRGHALRFFLTLTALVAATALARRNRRAAVELHDPTRQRLPLRRRGPPELALAA